MINLAVDSDNDLYIDPAGQMAMNEGVQAVLQSAQHAAQAQLGEMVLSIDQGVPNFQTIWESSANIAQFEAYLLRALLSVPNVTEVRELSTVVRDNRVIYSATIVTIYGTGDLTNG